MSIHITLTHTLHIEGTARLKLYHRVHGVEIITDMPADLKNDWVAYGPFSSGRYGVCIVHTYVHIWRSYQDRQTPGTSNIKCLSPIKQAY